MNKVTMVAIGIINKVEGLSTADQQAKAKKIAKSMIAYHGYPEALRRARMINAGELDLHNADKFVITGVTKKASDNATTIIKDFMGCPQDQEWYLLKGVLLAAGKLGLEVNTQMIAQRMDTLNGR